MKFTIVDGRSYYIIGELSHDDFDRTGRVSPWKLARLIEGARTQRDFNGPESAWWDGEQTIIFYRSQTYTIHPAFYSRLRELQNPSVKVVAYLSHIGTTSYWVEEELLDLLTHEPLARSTFQAVRISVETRRPTPLPPDAVKANRVIEAPDGKRPIRDADFPEKPAKHFMHKRTVMPSDTDSNEHFNQAGYLRFALDCIGMAAISGALSAFREDIAYSDTKKVWARYIREANVGEEVAISCWEDGDNCHMIWVELAKEPQIVLAQCQLEFYKESASKEQESLA